MIKCIEMNIVIAFNDERYDSLFGYMKLIDYREINLI